MSAPNDPPPPPGAPLTATSPAPGAAAPGGPSLQSIIKRMLAHLPVALVVLGLGVSITMVMARSRKPAYGSETIIQYREGIGREFVGVEGGNDLKALPGRLKDTLLARAHLEKIIKEFNLYPQIVAVEGYIAAVDKFKAKITFKPRSQETFLIAFEGATPEEAQEVTARLADVLIEDMTERKKAQAKTATDYLEAQKKEADDSLAKREADLAGFIAQHPEFAAENNAELAGSGVRAEKAKAIADPEILALDRNAQRIRAAMAAKVAGPGGAVAGGAPVAPDAKIVQAKQAADAELAAAEKDLSDKTDKLTDAHPDVKMARSRLAAAQAKQREATAVLIAATPTPGAPAAASDDPYESKGASSQERARLEAELAKNEREMQARKRGAKPDGNASAFANQVIQLETQWKELNREREKAKQRQASVDQRLNKALDKAATELGGYAEQVKVLDPAYLPTTSGSMPKSRFILLGILLSIAAGLALAAAWGVLLDDRVFMAEDLAAYAPVLAAVPKSAPEKGKRRG